MLQLDMTANVRNTFGKGAARTLRRQGQTPAVLYGAKSDPQALELDTKIFTKTLLDIRHRNAVINLAVEGGKKKGQHVVIIKELQTDPINDLLIHADFYEISLKEPRVFAVPLKIVGKAKGVDMGGEMTVAKPELPVKGLVLDIPDYIEVDVTNLSLGDRLTCKDLNIAANLELLEGADTTCIAISGVVHEEPEEEAAVSAAPAADEAVAEEAPAEE